MNSWLIAKNTFMKFMKNKSVYLLMLLCLCLMAVTTLYHTLTIYEDNKLLIDTGFFITSVIGMLIATFVGSREISQEMEAGTLDTLLAKPIGRDQVIMGKFLGTFLIGLTFVAVLGIGLICIMSFRGIPVGSIVFGTLLLIIMEVLVLSAVSICLSVIFPEVMGIIFSVLVMILGHLIYIIPILKRTSSSPLLGVIGDIIYYVLPNFQHFNIKNEITMGSVVPGSYILMACAYGLSYAAFVIVLAAIVFRKKDV